TSIFLESAYFDPGHIRKTSTLHGLKTDASFRFERGADPNMTLYALKRAALLMKEIAGGIISSQIVDVYPVPIKNRIIGVSIDGIEGLIGKKVGRQTIKNILKSLEIEIVAESEAGFSLSVPPFRVDVEREADIVEEVLRIYGYNNVEYNESVHASLSYNPKPDPEFITNNIAALLSANGFSEIMTNSLTSSAYYENSEIFPAGRCVKIVNPLSRELEVMRQTLLFGALESVSYNLNRRQNDLKFYEFGNVYAFNPSVPQEKDVTSRYSEHKSLSIIVTGKRMTESWYNHPQKADYHLLKSYVFLMLRKSGIEYWKWKSAEADARLYSEGENLSVNNKEILSLGRLQPSITKAFDIKQDVFYAEINWQSLLKMIHPDVKPQREIPRFPEVRRDLAMLLDKKVKFADIEAFAYKNAGPVLKSINLFDVFEGDQIGKDKKSYAVSFTLLDESKTLTDKEIERIMEKLVTAFTKELGAVIRK
ncbi:MAG TPA: phenylalanine--tRNA ligase subunit beta, partial [Bacteroidales bacterium]|nr:phenylalanine--tRNA ligase subunit beta [Bacteroidales bacterium]